MKALEDKRLLGPEREELVGKVRSALSDLQAELVRLRAAPEDEEALKASMRQLDELFLLVVVGEFNAGKSAFLNALMGRRILDEGVTPTTTRIQVLRHGPEVARQDEGPLLVITVPVEALRDISLVDTPGTNAIERQHEVITTEFVPRADLILFVTSADRPFTESERAFLERIREWGKKVIVVLNKVDIVEDEADIGRIEQFLRENMRALLGITPDIFAVSARRALRAKEASDEAALAASRFPPLEDYVISKLDEGERFRLKMLNPVNVGLRLVGQYASVVGNRLRLLDDDIVAVEQIQEQLGVYREDMERGFDLRVGDIENILNQFQNRGHEFFDELIRIGRVVDLLNKHKVRGDFERLVVKDAPRKIEEKVEAVIDWLVSSELKQWQAVREHLEQRKTEHADRIVAGMSGGFEYDRARLLDTVGRSAQRTLQQYDQRAEAQRIADAVQGSVAGAAAFEAGAVGVGAVIAAVATSSVVDITGILAASMLATVGLFVIPRRRRLAKEDLRRKIFDLRNRLVETLRSEFDKEVERSVRRIGETIEPYTRFVRGERGALERQRQALLKSKQTLDGLRQRLEPN